MMALVRYLDASVEIMSLSRHKHSSNYGPGECEVLQQWQQQLQNQRTYSLSTALNND